MELPVDFLSIGRGSVRDSQFCKNLKAVGDFRAGAAS